MKSYRIMKQKKDSFPFGTHLKAEDHKVPDDIINIS